MSINTSRHQFVGRDLRDPDRIGYKRKGGFFMSKGSCAGFVVLATLVAVVVGVIVYFMTAESVSKTSTESDFNFDKLRQDSSSIPARLPDDVVPESYKLEVIPYLNNNTFRGRVLITLTANKDKIKRITLNSKDLVIDKVHISEEITSQSKSRSKRDTSEEIKNGNGNAKTEDNNKDMIDNGTNIASNSKAGTSAVENAPLANAVKNNDTNVVKQENTNATVSQSDSSNSTVSETKANNVTNTIQKGSNATVNESSLSNSTDFNTVKSNVSYSVKKGNINAPVDISNPSSSSFNNASKITSLDSWNKTNIPETFNDTNKHEHNGVSKNVTAATNKDQNNDSISKDNNHVVNSAIKTINVKSYDSDIKTERLTIKLDSFLKKNNKYVLEVFYEGKISNDSNGVFIREHKDGDKTHVLLATHMEPSATREVFPCFDQPDPKSFFELSILHDKNYTAYSNTDIDSEVDDEKNPSYKRSNFKKTVIMSPYLVAFALTDGQAISTTYNSTDGKTKPIRVITMHGSDDAKYALRIIPKFLTFFEELFGIPYALEKLDVITIPNFAYGAMENWGLITCSELNCLYNEAKNNTGAKMEIALILAHEIAHQWFGNLVTMSWWNDIWLNEGFATYMQYLAVDKVLPGMNAVDILKRSKQFIFSQDSLATSQALSVAVDQQTQIFQKFDQISYDKGAQIIRMLNYTLGEKLFGSGIRQYLENSKYKNAVEDDLWAAMNEVAVKTVKFSNHSILEMMKTWTTQGGFPVVSVITNPEQGKVTFKQQIFTTSVSNVASHRNWIIPVTFVVMNPEKNTSEVETVWLTDKIKNIRLALKANDAVYVNVESAGYYRVNYDTRNWQLLSSIINGPNSPPSGQLATDVLNAARAGLSSYNLALSFLANISKAHDYPYNLREFDRGLKYLSTMLDSTQYYGVFQNFIMKIINDGLVKYEYGNRKPMNSEEAYLMALLVSWECECESERCISWSDELFGQWMKNPSKNNIPADLRYIVYKTAVKFGGKKEIDFLFDVLANEIDYMERDTILNSMGSTRDEALANLIIKRSVDDMALTEARSLWIGCTSKVCILAAQHFLQHNWAKLKIKYSGDFGVVMYSFINMAFGEIVEDYEYAWFKKFTQVNVEDLPPISNSIINMNEIALSNLNWKNKFTESVGKWLENFEKGIVNTTLEINDISLPNTEEVKTNATGEVKTNVTGEVKTNVMGEVKTNDTQKAEESSNSNATVNTSTNSTSIKNELNTKTSNVTNNETKSEISVSKNETKVEQSLNAKNETEKGTKEKSNPENVKQVAQGNKDAQNTGTGNIGDKIGDNNGNKGEIKEVQNENKTQVNTEDLPH